MANEIQTQVEMPKYRCHKEVWALKIESVIGPVDNGPPIAISFHEPGYANIPLDYGFFLRNPEVAADGYYVVYKDGYAAYSPAEAFEEGYTPV